MRGRLRTEDGEGERRFSRFGHQAIDVDLVFTELRRCPRLPFIDAVPVNQDDVDGQFRAR